MNASQFQRLLKQLGACNEAMEWAKGKDLAIVWSTCERGDWMLWLVRMQADKENWPTRQQVVLAACSCAEIALKYWVKAYPGDNRPQQAIETARKWARGEASLKEVGEAASAAWAAEAASRAAWAAYAAEYAAASAAWAAEAAYAAEYAAASAASLKDCADIVRKEIQLPLLVKMEVGR